MPKINPPTPAPGFHMLGKTEWNILRDARLAALQDSPASFLSTYEAEVSYDEKRWRDEFIRGAWIVLVTGDGGIDGLVGVTQADDIGENDRYLEYLWVSSHMRRSGNAMNLLQEAFSFLKAESIKTVWLWILDGNGPARRLYEKCGFASTGERQPLKADPSRSEERMRLTLAAGGAEA